LLGFAQQKKHLLAMLNKGNMCLICLAFAETQEALA
jgi:hypothetical protein